MLPLTPGNKTDDTDLAAIFRATVCGYGLQEKARDEAHEQLYLLARHRRNLVQKRSAVYCQIREHLEAVLPGYATLFGDRFWPSHVAMFLARHINLAETFVSMGGDGLVKLLREHDIRHQRRTVDAIVTWARQAASPHERALTHHRIFMSLDDDRVEKTRQISLIERDLAGWLAHTPYVLMLSYPGINVVTASELAGELGADRQLRQTRQHHRPRRDLSIASPERWGRSRKRPTGAHGQSSTARHSDADRRQPDQVQRTLPRPGENVGKRRSRTRAGRV